MNLEKLKVFFIQINLFIIEILLFPISNTMETECE